MRVNRCLKIIPLLLFLTVSIALADQYKCTRVYDGDTIKVTSNGSEITIRLVGIDAPESSKKKNEPGQPFSQVSTKYLAGLVLNKSLEIKSYGTDRYGRILGVVLLMEKMSILKWLKRVCQKFIVALLQMGLI
jgi:micrococcal nuclease